MTNETSRPRTWQDAFRDLESALHDAHNMATLAASIVEGADRPLLAFAVNHAANLADDLYEKWNKLHDEMSPPKEA